MPTYEFKCTKCDHEDEIIMSISEFSSSKDFKCEGCGEYTLERHFRTVANLAIPQHMRADPDKMKYHGVTNAVTGEGIKPYSDSEMSYMKMKKQQNAKKKK